MDIRRSQTNGQYETGCGVRFVRSCYRWVIAAASGYCYLSIPFIILKVGSRPVDAIHVTPGAEIAVNERGSLAQKMRGIAKRCSILGLGVLPGMSQGQLKSILAHAYGHFSNRDTSGGNLARQVLT